MPRLQASAGTGSAALPVGSYQEYWYTATGSAKEAAYLLAVLQSSPEGSVRGMLYLRYEDGRLDTVFPFSGVVNPGGVTATLVVTASPTVVVDGGVAAYAQATLSKSATITAELGKGTVTLEGCTQFLHFLTAAGGAPANGLAVDPQLCTFVDIGVQPYPSNVEIPITPKVATNG